MRGFREAVARDRWDYDLKRNAIKVLSQKWQDPVELIKGAWPAVNKHERQNPLIPTGRWAYMDEVHVQSCTTAKAEKHVGQFLANTNMDLFFFFFLKNCLFLKELHLQFWF